MSARPPARPDTPTQETPPALHPAVQALLRDGTGRAGGAGLRYRLAHAVRHGTVQFLAFFALFVLAGAAMEYLLEGRRAGSPFANFFEALWFTVVTITTVGYGDVAPESHFGKVWAMLEMFVGIGLVGVITGNVASVLVERNRKRALGLVPLSHLRGHTIVCGWKKDMRQILHGILDANPGLSTHDLVLVTTHAPAMIGELRRDPRLAGLHFVYGSHTDAGVLTMAQVQTAGRVLIVADQEGASTKDEADSRTVLAAQTVEHLNRMVYTCTELVQPHFRRYLRQARVEDVVLGSQNARALIAAASLGDGISRVVARLLPESGAQLRMLRVPAHLVGRPYGELAQWLAARGLLPLGLMENTGNLYDRRRAALSDALRHADYPQAVAALQHVARLDCNIPVFAPAPERIVAPHAAAMALLPAARSQSPEEAERRRTQYPQARDPRPEHLVVCGWKHDMADLLQRIVGAHHAVGRSLARITIVARLPDAEAEAVLSHDGPGAVDVVLGEPTDPQALQRAGVPDAQRVLILCDPIGAQSGQEADARNVLAAIAVHGLNRSAYKCVEILNPGFGRHLRAANVEESVYTQRYQQMMLVQGSLGTGLSGAVSALLHPERPVLRVVDFPGGRPGDTLAEHERRLAARGLILLGVIDHAGNQHARKHEYLEQAQVQPHVRDAVEHLLRMKTVVGNEALLHPGADYRPGDHSRAVVLTPPPAGPAAT